MATPNEFRESELSKKARGLGNCWTLPRLGEIGANRRKTKPTLNTKLRILPAKIVHDKFHVSKHLNEAVDKVRRRENNALQAEGDDRLKGARQLFLFNPENLPKDRVADFEALKNSDLKAARAWAIKESFRSFWQCKTLKEAQGVFKKWYAWAIRCRLHEIKKVARMLKSHLDGLLNFVFFPITNAVAEGFNSKIQSLKADARGFRNFLNYRIRILFFCGRLNLLPSL